MYRRTSKPDLQSEKAIIMRERVCAAIMRDGHILLVRHQHDRRDYWTLPGGGIEAGEHPEQAVLREVGEEVKLHGTVVRLLFEHIVSGPCPIKEACYLVVVPDAQHPLLGHDPELPYDAQMLTAVSWFSLHLVHEGRQVSKVLTALRSILAE